MPISKKNGHPVLGRPEFEEELLGHRKSLFAFAFSLTKSRERAEDLSHETYLKAILNQDKFTPGTHLRSWLFTIMRNEWYSLYRKGLREQAIDPEIIKAFPAPRDDLKFEEEQQVARDFASIVPFLACLPQAQCDTLISVHYLELTYEQTSYILGIEVGTVKSRVSRALETINRLRLTEDIEYYDLSLWATATKGIPKDHLYFPIAQAYEDIYAFMVSNASSSIAKRNVSKPEESDIDQLYRQMREAGSLDEGGEDLYDLMRDDLG